MLFDDQFNEPSEGDGEGKPLDAKARRAAQQKAYYEANREKKSASHKAWREANREKVLAQNKAWYEANREKVLAQKKAYREVNRERKAAYQKAYYEANREQILAQQKAYNEANPEKKAVYRKAYREANREKIAAKDKARSMSKAAREKIRHFLLVKQRGKCASCGIDCIEDHHLDHIVPLAKGGTNEACNFQILCPTCNLKKNAADPVEFARRNGKLI